MSTENDVPLGEGSRRYYEQKFGDRIRQVSKGGDSVPRPKNDSPNYNGRAGCGVAVAVIMGIRIIMALVNSSSHTTSQKFNLPPSPQFNGNAFPGNRVQENEAMQRLRQILEDQKQAPIPPPFLNPADLDMLLTADDVPLLEGLCYRLNQERLRPGESPGKHFLALLDPVILPSVIKAAHGQALDPNEREEILQGLNEVIQHNEFWNPDAFARLRGMPEYARILETVQRFDGLPLARLKERRRLLELCYPFQIAPLQKRNKLDPRARDACRKRAKLDLEAARREDQR